MKVFVTGGTGFVGREIINQLLKSGHQATVLTRNPNKIEHKGINIIKGDIRKIETFEKSLLEHDTVIHLIGIIREYPYLGITFENIHLKGTQNVLKAAKKAGIERFLYMSALGVGQGIKTKYFQTKKQAENEVKNSGLNYTIFRPSIIFGPNDKSLNTFAKLIKIFGIVPVFGDKNVKLQPIYVNDVAEIFVQSLEDKTSFAEILSLCGPKVYTLEKLLFTIAKILKTQVKIIPIPKDLAKTLLYPFDNLPLLPITSESIEMLNHDNICINNQKYHQLENLEKVLPLYLR